MLTVQLSPFHRLNSDRGPPIADHCSRGWSFKEWVYCVIHQLKNDKPYHVQCWNLFSCANKECIDSSSICDGIADCSDKSDETQSLCAPLFKTCPGSAFRCNYGACISKNAKCNGKNDCVDGSDEQLPECKKLGLSIPSSPPRPQQTQATSQVKCIPREEYRCTSGQCIDITTICDGTSDCNDGSDETSELCKSMVCPMSTFKCNYGACISKQRKCDGSQHCADGSDEAGCGSNGDRKPLTPVNPTSHTTQRPTSAPQYQTSRPTTQRPITQTNNMR
ncbi:hypothetical protein ACI65C_011766 [Semiaphis heraclei]